MNLIIPYIPEDALIVLDDNIFYDKNPQNARNIMIQNVLEKKYNNKKLDILFRDSHYNSFEEIYNLEKYMGLIKSHIPNNANELDIITYVTLFMINYFKYDYEMYENIEQRLDYEEINITQLIDKGKGVCRHFASFTEYMLNSLVIECKKIGSSGIYNTDGHEFNVVKINGKNYFLDNTWILNRMQDGSIHSLVESTDFLTSNKDFEHEIYEDILSDYHCESYDRQAISESVNRVLKWNKDYFIHASSLRDLFRKHVLKKEKSVAERIEDAILRRK